MLLKTQTEDFKGLRKALLSIRTTEGNRSMHEVNIIEVAETWIEIEFPNLKPYISKGDKLNLMPFIHYSAEVVEESEIDRDEETFDRETLDKMEWLMKTIFK
jgi:hypothetical protein